MRPEDWQIGSEGGLDVTVAVVEELGSEAFLYCTDDTVDEGHELPTMQVVARAEGLSANVPGDRVSLVPRPDRLHVFDTATGARV